MSRYFKAAFLIAALLSILILSAFFDPADFAMQTDIRWIYEGGLTSSQARRVRISAVGDLMLHERQYEDALRHGIGGGTPDFNYSFSFIRGQFARSDIVIGNLETVLGGEFHDYPSFSAPDEFAHAIKNAGFTMLTTANSRALDMGPEGLYRTLDILEELGITSLGTYRTPEERDNILIKEMSGISFAFLSYTYDMPVPDSRYYLVNIYHEELFTADIRRARETGVDFVIVLPHWGYEYDSHVRQRIRNVARSMFRAGADIILGHHPHVVQSAEFVHIIDDDGTERLGFVAYSLGNFISGQRIHPRDAGVIFHLYFEQQADERPTFTVSFVPTWVKWWHNREFIDIAVLSAFDVLNTHMWGGDTGLAQQDIDRVRDAHLETTRTVTGSAVPLDAIAPEYFILP